MAIYSPRLWWVAVTLLLWAPHTHSRELTHEDIRDALLSLVQKIRTIEGKLERHELREKAFGDQQKKMLMGLDKKHRALEPLISKVSRLDDRLSNVETILLQKEEREKLSQKKIDEALDTIQKTLQAIANPPPKPPAELDNSLSATDDALQRRLDTTDAKIDTVKKEIRGLKDSLSKDSLRAMCLDVASDINPYEKHISDTENLLNKFELKLNEYNGIASKGHVDLNEVSQADEAWHNKMTEVMERQEKDVKKIQRLLSDAESMWKDLPRLADLHRSTNQTLDAISRSTEAVVFNNDNSVDKVLSKIRDMGDRLATTNKDIQQSLTQSNTMTESAYSNIANSYASLQFDVQTLTNSKQMIIETHDNVIATKKRLEYGVNQIIAELREFIKLRLNNMDTSNIAKWKALESSITSNQTIAINNLTSNLDMEMDKIWRQIGIMFVEITSSKESLYNLTIDSQQFSNKSTSTLKRMKTEVSGITQKIDTLTDNLNYGLQALSLVTQEFKLMTTDLYKMLNINLKNNDKPKVQDKGPGPHNITSAEETP